MEFTYTDSDSRHRACSAIATKTACEGGLIPAHSGSIVSYEGYRTSCLSRRTRSGISAGLRDQQLPSASSVGGVASNDLVASCHHGAQRSMEGTMGSISDEAYALASERVNRQGTF